jgi:serine/threonine-protein kinase
MIGRVLDGRYTIESKLGAGSMGTVYKSKQHAMGRNVAIKILRSDRALDEASRARFLREARANSLLASPNTVTVFDFGQADNGDFFLAMELLEGESLGDRLKREKRLAPEMAVDVARQALRSLSEAHGKGIIHRDLKPDNLFFAKTVTVDENGARKDDEVVKVVDFGIAKMLGGDNLPMNAIETQAGTVFGTPRYMSPEQAQGKPLDARSDLYSLGVILYHMLTGRPPFTDDDAIVVMARHIKTPPKRPIEAAPHAGIPQELENVVMRVLGKEPYQRPPSAEALSQELGRAMNLSSVATSGIRSAPPSAPPASLAGAVPLVFPPPPLVPKVPGAPGQAAVPPAPMSDGSLTTMPSSTASLEVAAGVKGKPGALRTVLLALGSLVLVGGAALAFRAAQPPPARTVTSVQRDVAPASAAAAIPPPPAAPATVTIEPAPASSIPSTSFADLPKAAPEPRPSRGWTPPPPRPSPHREPSAQKPSPPPAASSSTGHYGLFE